MNKYTYLALIASVSAVKVTPAGNVPADPKLTAGAAVGSQPRWGSRYPKIPVPVARPVNHAVPSTPCTPGPLGDCNGDSQSFFARSFAQVTPAGNVPADPKLTAGAAVGSQPRWGSRYPKIPVPVARPVNHAVPSTPCTPGPLGDCNGDSQSFIRVQEPAKDTGPSDFGSNLIPSMTRGIMGGVAAVNEQTEQTLRQVRRRDGDNGDNTGRPAETGPVDLGANLIPAFNRAATAGMNSASEQADQSLKQERKRDGDNTGRPAETGPVDLGANLIPAFNRAATAGMNSASEQADQSLKQERKRDGDDTGRPAETGPVDFGANIIPAFKRVATAGANSANEQAQDAASLSQKSKSVTPDHPEFKPDLTAGAPVGTGPRFGKPYRGYNAAQAHARRIGGVAVRF